MPYTQIHWVKLEKRLQNDHRFYFMSEESQLIYLKLLMLAAETNNKVPKSCSILKHTFRSKLSEVEIQGCIDEIMENFPKFRLTKGFYRFGEWSKRHNYIAKKESQGNSKGTPIDGLDKIRKDKIRKEYIKRKGFPKDSLFSDDYARIGRGVKDLLVKAGTDDLAIEAINWVADKGYEWTLETVIKKFPEFMSGQKSDRVKELEAMVEKM